MSPAFANTMRRFSRGNSFRNSKDSTTSTSAPQQYGANTQSGSYSPPQTGHSAPNGGLGSNATHSAQTGPSSYHAGHDSRPISAESNSSFDFMNRPISHQHHQVPSSAMSGLSRTDQVVLRFFWEDKYAENAKRDLHFVSLSPLPRAILGEASLDVKGTLANQTIS